MQAHGYALYHDLDWRLQQQIKANDVQGCTNIAGAGVMDGARFFRLFFPAMEIKGLAH